MEWYGSIVEVGCKVKSFWLHYLEFIDVSDNNNVPSDIRITLSLITQAFAWTYFRHTQDQGNMLSRNISADLESPEFQYPGSYHVI